MTVRSNTHNPFLLVRTGDTIAALALAHVVETLRPLPVEPVGMAPSFVLGLSVLRGVATPVIDLGALLNGARSAAPSRYVALRLGDRRVALAVDAVVGVRELEADALSSLPPLLRDAGADAVAWVGTRDAGLLLVLETARLLPDLREAS